MRALILTICLSALVAVGCHDNEVCNPGLQLVDGVCVPGLPAADAGWSPADAAPDAPPADAGQD